MLSKKTSINNIGTWAHLRVWTGHTNVTDNVMQSYAENCHFLSLITACYVVNLMMKQLSMDTIDSMPIGITSYIYI